MRTGIALGSNLGDRYALLQFAVAQLRLLHGEGEFLVSSFHETKPHECPPDSPNFLNAVVEIETSLLPLDLLHHLQALEQKAGRPSNHEFHGSRTLDLDILYYGAKILISRELQLPHPRITERPFVLKPLAEIRPHLSLPGWSMSCQMYLRNLDKK
jgi:2-amino-4-hydroxy-6-hydroxymethyldihydropteridine diphosphokinase